MKEDFETLIDYWFAVEELGWTHKKSKEYFGIDGNAAIENLVVCDGDEE